MVGMIIITNIVVSIELPITTEATILAFAIVNRHPPCHRPSSIVVVVGQAPGSVEWISEMAGTESHLF
jgi:hypothetical protein